MRDARNQAGAAREPPVMLCGAVDVASQRDAAERIAVRVPGVSEVRNRLKVW